MKFRKKKWQRLQSIISKLRKKKLYDPISYFLFNFKNFFNRKFRYNLQNKQRLSFFYGRLRKKYLKKVIRFILQKFKNLNKHASILLIRKLETRLDTVLYRAYFSYSFRNARQLISHKKIYVNHKIVQSNSYALKKGDLITLNEDLFESVILNIRGTKTWPIPPTHLCINYKTLQILVTEEFNYTSCYPFWIDFNSFIQFYER